MWWVVNPSRQPKCNLEELWKPLSTSVSQFISKLRSTQTSVELSTLEQTLEWIWLLHFPNHSTRLQEGEKKVVLSFLSPLLSLFFFFWEISSLRIESYSWQAGEHARGLLPAQTMEIFLLPLIPTHFLCLNRNVAHWKTGNYCHSNRWLGPHRKERFLGFTLLLAAWQGDFFCFSVRDMTVFQFSMGNAFENWNEKERY